MDRRELLLKVEMLQILLVARATNEPASSEDYKSLRDDLLQEPTIKAMLPRFVTAYSNLDQFWSFIKKYAHYQERREFLWSEFAPLTRKLEIADSGPADASILQALGKLDADHVREAWERALARKTDDPEGAITAARTLLESVSKSILDDLGATYEDDADLPKLYRLVSEQLNLAPSQHTEQVFRQILGGCKSVVEGLGAVRNRLGDSHGQGKLPVRPAPRHAELAVNLAGAMATFLVQTWENSKATAGGKPVPSLQ